MEQTKTAGRKPTANPRTNRITILVTPAEQAQLQAAANAGFEGNISLMVRTLVFQALPAPAFAPIKSEKE